MRIGVLSLISTIVALPTAQEWKVKETYHANSGDELCEFGYGPWFEYYETTVDPAMKRYRPRYIKHWVEGYKAVQLGDKRKCRLKCRDTRDTRHRKGQIDRGPHTLICPSGMECRAEWAESQYRPWRHRKAKKAFCVPEDNSRIILRYKQSICIQPDLPRWGNKRSRTMEYRANIVPEIAVESTEDRRRVIESIFGPQTPTESPLHGNIVPDAEVESTEDRRRVIESLFGSQKPSESSVRASIVLTRVGQSSRQSSDHGNAIDWAESGAQSSRWRACAVTSQPADLELEIRTTRWP